MKKIYLLLLLIVAASCTKTILVDQESLKKIPYGSTKVISTSPRPASEVFSLLSKSFAREGCPVKTDKESMQVICDGKSVEGGTTIKAMAYVESDGDGSVVTITGEWGLNANGQLMMSAFGAHGVSSANKVVWEGLRSTKPCIAFQYMILLTKDIPEGKLSYGKN